MKGVLHEFTFDKEKNLVCLANNDDGYYYQVFESPEELKSFIDEAKKMLSEMLLNKIEGGRRSSKTL